MQSLKNNGIMDVRRVIGRARKVRALGRISGQDLEYIERRLLEVEARIISMEEVDMYGKEILE